MQVLLLNNIPVFFAERDGPWFPTLRLLHQYPDMMVKLRVDAGMQCVRAVQPAQEIQALHRRVQLEPARAACGPPVGTGGKDFVALFANQGSVGAVLQVRLLRQLTCTCLQVPSSL